MPRRNRLRRGTRLRVDERRGLTDIVASEVGRPRCRRFGSNNLAPRSAARTRAQGRRSLDYHPGPENHAATLRAHEPSTESAGITIICRTKCRTRRIENAGGRAHLRRVLASYNPSTRSFSAIASSFADVKRAGLFGSFVERLPCSPNAWDLSRVAAPAGVPLLAGHQSIDPRAKIGRLQAARVTAEGLAITADLSESSLARELEPQIADGTAALSIGYEVGPLVRVGEDADGVPIFEPAHVSLVEVSLVGAAADAGAFIRSYAGGFPMPDPTVESTRQPGGVTEIRPARPDHEATERSAIFGIMQRSFGIGPEWALQHAGDSITDLRRAAFERLAERDEALPPTFSQVATTRGHDPRQATIAALAIKLGARSLPERDVALGRELLSRSGGRLLDVGRNWLNDHGARAASADQIVDAMISTRAFGGSLGALNTTSDFFPQLMAAAGEVIVLEAYQASASPLLPLARDISLTDFNKAALVGMSSFPELLEVNEHGEIQRGKFADSGETISLRTFARIVGVTRQVLINDATGVIADRLRTIGRSASDLIGKILADLLSTNAGLGATMADGLPLYHADHSNLLAGADALDVDGLSAARLAMRQQVSLDGRPINVTPAYLVVGPALETTAEQLLTTLNPATVEDTNPFAGKLRLIVDPALSGPAWRLFADPDQLPVLRVAYLNDQREPQIATREGFDVLGFEVRITHDAGAAVSDFRGTVYSAGTSP